MTTFTASPPSPPDNLPLRAELAWQYFFGRSLGCWQVVHTANGAWIITDESCDLDEAMIYPDDESFIAWLEEVTTEHLEDDRIAFLRQFCLVPELIDGEVALLMEKRLNTP